MPRIFEIKDKTGRYIYLTDERWKHMLKHPGMANHLGRIEETLTHPNKIVETV